MIDRLTSGAFQRIGSGPAGLSRLARDRSVRLVSALALAIAVPTIVLFYFQFQSLSDLAAASAVVLRQMSRDTAETMVRDVSRSLQLPHTEVLLAVDQGKTEPLDLVFIQSAFAEGLPRYPFVDRFYVWSDVTTDHRDELLASDRANPTLHGQVRESGVLLQNVERLAQRKKGVNSFTLAIDGRRTYVIAQTRYQGPARERLSSFVGLAVDAERLRHEYFPTWITDWLRTAGTPTGFPPLKVTVLDERSRVIYPDGGSAEEGYVEERPFALGFYSRELFEYVTAADRHPEVWRIRTGYGNQSVADIIEARGRPQRAMMVVLAVAMALSVFFIVRVAMREVRLAELKSDFVSSVSHDLKTPLALIQLFSETLELGRLKNSERVQEYYRVINSEARKLTRLINNILDFSRIEAGLRRYKVDAHDLGALTTRVLASLESQFKQNTFTVSCEIAPDLPAVLIDPEAAQQAIENLLSNAMKYSPEHRQIQVRVDSLGGYGRVRVTDHGIGIPPRLRQRIFRKFYRVDEDSGPHGCGLGLAIVDHVMRGHHGFVTVESEVGRGSTFTLHFPICAGELPRDETDSGDRGRAADVARTA